MTVFTELLWCILLNDSKMNDIIQLKITLKGTKPPIWRRVLVNKKTTFFRLHYIIQTSMGWENSHLFEFNIYGYRIGELALDDEDYNDGLIDSTTKTLDSIIIDVKKYFEYTYDLGDSWDHEIFVEKFVPIDEKMQYPICIAGKLNCPPEDCGGIWGFYDLLKIIKNKKDPEYKEMLEWLGGQYDAEYFDKEIVNEKFMDWNVK